MIIRLEFKDTKSHKFWEGVVEGNTVVTRWGQVGSDGQSKSFELGSQAAAEAELAKKAGAKIKKGYVEVGSSGSSTSATSKKSPAKAAPTKSAAKVAPKKSPAKTSGAPVTPPPYPVLDPTELNGDTIRLSDYPRSFAFSEDGRTLAAHGISSVHLCDVPSRTWSTTHKSKEATALLFHDEGLLVGTKTITLVNRDTGKKIRAFKGHKAPAHALALSGDGKTLWSGGGNYMNTHDRFLYAFDASTEALRYKVKPGKGAGAMDVAVLDDVVAVAAEDGHVRTFAAADGKPLADVELAPPEEYGSAFGGVAVSGGGFVAAARVEGVCVVTWLSRDLEVEASATVVIRGAEHVHVHHPFVVAGHIVIVIGAEQVVVAVIDEATRALVALRVLPELDDWRCCAVSNDGLIAWKAREGVAIAPLLGKASKAIAPPKPKNVPEPAPASDGSITTVGVMTGGGPSRQGVFEGALTEAPKVLWARDEYHGGADEFGGSVVVGDGIAVGSYAGWVCALDAGTGETRWATETASSRSWATSGIGIARDSVFIATNHGLLAYDAHTGEQRWRGRVAGAAGAPLLFEDVCVIGGLKGLHARSIEKQGRKAWTFPVKDRVQTAPAYADGLAYFYADAQLLAVDLAAQQLVWSAPAGMPLRAGPVIAGDLIVYIERPGVLAAAERRTGKQAWSTKVDALVGGRFWACTSDTLLLRDDDGRIQAYDVSTGQARWTAQTKRTKPYGIGCAGPIVADTTVIAVTVENSTAISGTTYLTGMDLKTGKVRWDLDASGPRAALAKEQKKTGSGFSGGWSWYCTPFVCDGILYAQTDAGIVALR